MGKKRTDFQKGAILRMAAYAEKLREYRKIREPDKEKIGELVKKARGPSRSLRQFADEIDVNPSTVSKVENNKATGISDEFLVKVAEHADSDSGVTLEILLSANGMERDRRLSFRAKADEFERVSSDIIKNELFRGNYYATNASDMDIFLFGRIGRPSLMLRTDALGENESIWLFSCSYSIEEEDERRGMTMAAIIITERVSAIMSSFYCGNGEIGKWSLLLNSRKAFDECKRRLEKRFEGRKIRDLISLILVDEEKRYVVDEWYIPSEKDEIKVFPGEPPEEKSQDYPLEGQLTFDDYMHLGEYINIEKFEEGNE